jgi:hypothetical protein
MRGGMNNLQLLLLAAIGVSLVVTFVMKLPRASRKSARSILGSAQWLDDSSADGSLVKLRGVVKMRDHGERFLSPLSDNRCVIVRVRVAVRHGRVDPRAKLVDDLKIMPFLIEDDDGKVLVDATAAALDITPLKSTKWTVPKKKQLLADLGHENANPDASDFEETLVEVGATVVVAGTLKRKDTDPKERLVGDAEHPIAIALERVRTDIANEP